MAEPQFEANQPSSKPALPQVPAAALSFPSPTPELPPELASLRDTLLRCTAPDTSDIDIGFATRLARNLQGVRTSQGENALALLREEATQLFHALLRRGMIKEAIDFAYAAELPAGANSSPEAVRCARIGLRAIQTSVPGAATNIDNAQLRFNFSFGIAAAQADVEAIRLLAPTGPLTDAQRTACESVKALMRTEPFSKTWGSSFRSPPCTLLRLADGTEYYSLSRIPPEALNTALPAKASGVASVYDGYTAGRASLVGCFREVTPEVWAHAQTAEIISAVVREHPAGAQRFGEEAAALQPHLDTHTREGVSLFTNPELFNSSVSNCECVRLRTAEGSRCLVIINFRDLPASERPAFLATVRATLRARWGVSPGEDITSGPLIRFCREGDFRTMTCRDGVWLDPAPAFEAPSPGTSRAAGDASATQASTTQHQNAWDDFIRREAALRQTYTPAVGELNQLLEACSTDTWSSEPGTAEPRIGRAIAALQQYQGRPEIFLVQHAAEQAYYGLLRAGNFLPAQQLARAAGLPAAITRGFAASEYARLGRRAITQRTPSDAQSALDLYDSQFAPGAPQAEARTRVADALAKLQSSGQTAFVSVPPADALPIAPATVPSEAARADIFAQALTATNAYARLSELLGDVVPVRGARTITLRIPENTDITIRLEETNWRLYVQEHSGTGECVQTVMLNDSEAVWDPASDVLSETTRARAVARIHDMLTRAAAGQDAAQLLVGRIARSAAGIAGAAPVLPETLSEGNAYRYFDALLDTERGVSSPVDLRIEGGETVRVQRNRAGVITVTQRPAPQEIVEYPLVRITPENALSAATCNPSRGKEYPNKNAFATLQALHGKAAKGTDAARLKVTSVQASAGTHGRSSGATAAAEQRSPQEIRMRPANPEGGGSGGAGQSRAVGFRKMPVEITLQPTGDNSLPGTTPRVRGRGRRQNFGLDNRRYASGPDFLQPNGESGSVQEELETKSAVKTPSAFRAALKGMVHTGGMAALMSLVELAVEGKLDSEKWRAVFPNVPFTEKNVGMMLGEVFGISENMFVYKPSEVGALAHCTLVVGNFMGSLYMFKAGDWVATRIAAEGVEKAVYEIGLKAALRRAAEKGALNTSARAVAEVGAMQTARAAKSAFIKRTLGALFGPAFVAHLGFKGFDFSTQDYLYDHEKHPWGGDMFSWKMGGLMTLGGILAGGAAPAGTLLMGGLLWGRAKYQIWATALQNQEDNIARGIRESLERVDLGLSKPFDVPPNKVDKHVKDLLRKKGNMIVAGRIEERGVFPLARLESNEERESLRSLLESIDREQELKRIAEQASNAVGETGSLYYNSLKTEIRDREHKIRKFSVDVAVALGLRMKNDPLPMDQLPNSEIQKLIGFCREAQAYERQSERDYERVYLVRYDGRGDEPIKTHDGLEDVERGYLALADAYKKELGFKDLRSKLVKELENDPKYKKLTSSGDRIVYKGEKSNEMVHAYIQNFRQHVLPQLQEKYLADNFADLSGVMLAQSNSLYDERRLEGRILLQKYAPTVWASKKVQEEVLLADAALEKRDKDNQKRLEIIANLPQEKRELLEPLAVIMKAGYGVSDLDWSKAMISVLCSKLASNKQPEGAKSEPVQSKGA